MNFALRALRSNSSKIRTSCYSHSTMTAKRQLSTMPNVPKPPGALMNVWRTILKRNSTYVAYVVAGCIVLEVVYGGLTNGVWRAMNYGYLYEDIDWTKFEVVDEEEEEDDE